MLRLVVRQALSAGEGDAPGQRRLTDYPFYRTRKDAMERILPGVMCHCKPQSSRAIPHSLEIASGAKAPSQ